MRQFATRRAAERDVLDRVKGTEAMFALWHLPARPGSYSGRARPSDASAPRSCSRSRPSRTGPSTTPRATPIWRSSAIERSRSPCSCCARAKRSSTRSSTRYGDSKEVESLFAEQERLRPLVERERAAEREALAQGSMDRAQRKSIEAVREAQARVDAAKTDVAAERAREARSRPILKDEELSSKSLDVGTAAELGEVLRSDAKDRLHDIEKTRARVISDREAVFQFDRHPPAGAEGAGRGRPARQGARARARGARRGHQAVRADRRDDRPAARPRHRR